ncbi:MAG: hypothetical protein ACM3W8_07255 [Sideroxydans sp.]|nr:hypothetical protein [Sideroxyarcus sp.]
MNASAAVLKIDGLDLLFQQSDVRALESASSVDGNASREGSVGWISYMRQRWPVYCLSDQLELLIGVPPSRRTCALLALETGYVGMLCNDVTIVKWPAGQCHEVPVAMKRADTPVLGLLPSGDKLLCVSAPNRLAAYIEHQVHKSALPGELPCPA